MDGGKLLAAHPGGCKAQNAVADGSQLPGIGAGGQDIRRGRVAGEDLRKAIHGIGVGLAVHIRGRVVLLMGDLHLDAVFLRDSVQCIQILLQILLVDMAQHGGCGADFLVGAALHTLESDGGTHHAAGSCVDFGKDLLQQPTEEPQIGKHHVQGEGAVGTQLTEHSNHRPVELPDKKIAGGHLMNEGAHTLHRVILVTGEAYMVAGPGCGALDLATALFVYSHHGAFFAVHIAQRRIHNGAALVQNDLEADVPLPEPGKGGGHAVAAQFFIVGGKNVEIDLRLISLPQHIFGGEKNGAQGALGVGGAPSVDLSVGNGAGEGGIGPGFVPGHHIVVGHEENIPAGILTGDLIEPAVIGQQQMLRLFMEQGEPSAHHFPELGKLRIVIGIPDGYRGALKHFTQSFAVDLHLFVGAGGIAALQFPFFGGTDGGIEQQNTDKNGSRGQQNGNHSHKGASFVFLH